MRDRILDLIAIGYKWLYHVFLQRPADQPFTAQASRMEARWPSFVWITAIIIISILARFNGWLLLLTAAVDLFASWFFAHIVRYRVAHPENVPFYSALNAWANRRLESRCLWKHQLSFQ